MQKRKVSIKPGEPAGAAWVHKMTPVHKIVCMHAIFLHAQAHILVKLDWIRESKVSLELGEHARPLWAHKVTQADKLAGMPAMFLHAEAQISAKLGQIRYI